MSPAAQGAAIRLRFSTRSGCSSTIAWAWKPVFDMPPMCAIATPRWSRSWSSKNVERPESRWLYETKRSPASSSFCCTTRNAIFTGRRVS
jgi:hypothetical protein